MLTLPIPAINGFVSKSPVDGMQSPTSKGTRAAKRLSKTLVQSQFIKSPMNRNPEVPEKPFHERVFDALKKINRTEDEARLILPIIKDFAFFKAFSDDDDIPPDAMLYICQNLRYEYFPENTVVFVQGDGSNGKGYLIFSGEVSVVEGTEEVLNKIKKKSNPQTKDSNTPKSKGLGRGFIKSGTRDFTNFNFINKSNNNTPKSQSKFSAELAHNTSHENIPHVHIITDGGDDKQQAHDSFGHRLMLHHQQESQDFNGRKPHQQRRRSIRPMARRQSEVHSESGSNTSRSRRSSAAEPPVTLSNAGAFLAVSFAGKLKQRRKSRVMDLNGHINMYGTLQNTLSKGAFFGEHALTQNQPRGATIITNTSCEFLIMTKDLFDYIKYTFNRNKRKVLTFMQQNMPKLDTVTSPKIMENLYYLVEEQIYSVGNYIIKEGDSAEQFFLLFEGECEMSKAIYTDQSSGFKVVLSEISPLVRVGRMTKENIPFGRIQPGLFFGEEILYKRHAKYQFSIQVKSNRAIVLMFKKNGFMMRFPRACYNALKEIFSQKNIAHAARIRDLVKHKYPKAKIDDNFALDIVESDEPENNEIIQEHVELKLKEVNPKTYKDNFRKTKKDSNYHFKIEDKHPPAPEENKLVIPEIASPEVKSSKLDVIPKSSKRVEELKDLFLPLSRNEIYNKHLKNPFLGNKSNLDSSKPKISEVTESSSPEKKSPDRRSPEKRSPEKRSPSPKMRLPPSPEPLIPERGSSDITSPYKLSPSKLKEPSSPLKHSAFKAQKSNSVSQMPEIKNITKMGSAESLNLLKISKSPRALHSRTQSLIAIISPKERHINIKPVKAPKQEVIRNDGAATKGTWTTFYNSVKTSPTYQYLRPPKTDVYDIEASRLKFCEESETQIRQRTARIKTMFQLPNPLKTFLTPRSVVASGSQVITWMKNLDPPMWNDPAASLASFRGTENVTQTDINLISPKNASIYDYSELSSIGKLQVAKHDTAKEVSPSSRVNISQMMKDLGKQSKGSIHTKMLQQKHQTMGKLKKKTQYSTPNSPSSDFSLKPSTSFPITRSSSIVEEFS